MYYSQWGLDETPFPMGSAATLSQPGTEEALAHLQFLVDQHHRFGLLVGPAQEVASPCCCRFWQEDAAKRAWMWPA